MSGPWVPTPTRWASGAGALPSAGWTGLYDELRRHPRNGRWRRGPFSRANLGGASTPSSRALRATLRLSVVSARSRRSVAAAVPLRRSRRRRFLHKNRRTILASGPRSGCFVTPDAPLVNRAHSYSPVPLGTLIDARDTLKDDGHLSHGLCDAYPLEFIVCVFFVPAMYVPENRSTPHRDTERNTVGHGVNTGLLPAGR